MSKKSNRKCSKTATAVQKEQTLNKKLSLKSSEPNKNTRVFRHGKKIKLKTYNAKRLHAPDTNEKIIKELVEKNIIPAAKLNDLKNKYAKRYKTGYASNTSLLASYRKLLKNKSIRKNKEVADMLKTNKIRTLSGVSVIAVLTKPAGCPGKCVYCPTEKNLPKSYLSGEPAVMRAVMNKFDPYNQVITRLNSLSITGHETDKIELIVIGGTFSTLPKDYKTWFIKKCFEACNHKKLKVKNEKLKIKDKNSNLSILKKIQKENEKAKHRIIGITVETRPDYIKNEEIIFLRQLGVTRIELGVQSIYDDVLALSKRGHDIAQTAKATKLLKDAGFKIGYHMMPNLPGMTPEKDIKTFKELFSNPDFQPDLLKIYPTVVTKNSELYNWWKNGKYTPYDDGTLTRLLLEIKKNIPPYVRISRLIRDIPAKDIISGSKISNLRQILDSESKKQGWHCQCIRCREIGRMLPWQTQDDDLKIIRRDYSASGGKEIFLSFEDVKNNKLYALLRLRIPSEFFERKKHFIPALNGAAIIREVHTYGQIVGIAKKSKGAAQHTGLGKQLIAEAERIAKENFGFQKIAVISGIGVRDYYRKLGYKLQNEYMVKKLN